MKTWIGVSICAVTMAGCAAPQFRTRLVPFDGGRPSVPAEQAEAICRARAQAAYAGTRGAAQADLQARNNRVTSYNCSTYGQANAYGNTAYYSGSTNCAPVTASPYGGKYGALIALGDVLNVEGAAADAHNSVLSGCVAEYGYRLTRYCVANCGDGAATTSAANRSPATSSTPMAGASYTPTPGRSMMTEARESNSAELCYRYTYHPDESVKMYSKRVLDERRVNCEAGRVTSSQ